MCAQSDMLFHRHLKPRDVYVHADVNGAPVCVVKCAGAANEVPPLTLSQAGDAVMCRSDAWTSRAVTSAWWVQASQVRGCSRTVDCKTSLRVNLLELVVSLSLPFRIRSHILGDQAGSRWNNPSHGLDTSHW